MYQIFVGEIGISRKVFLLELRWWEVNSILKGYRRRQRTLCDVLRWQTWLLASTQVKLDEVGVKCSQDLINFPWDEENDEEEEEEEPAIMSADEEQRLKDLILQENLKRKSASI